MLTDGPGYSFEIGPGMGLIGVSLSCVSNDVVLAMIHLDGLKVNVGG